MQALADIMCSQSSVARGTPHIFLLSVLTIPFPAGWPFWNSDTEAASYSRGEQRPNSHPGSIK